MPGLLGKCELPKESWKKIRGSTNEDFYIIEDLDEECLKTDLKKLKGRGIESLAVVLMHSYT